MKYSRQRELIFGAVCQNHHHPTADDVYTALKKDHPSLSLGTVYRNLNQMAACGRLLKLQLPGQIDRFDAATDDHYHFLCRECGKVYDVSKAVMPLPELDEAEGGQVLAVHVFLEGICQTCRNHV